MKLKLGQSYLWLCFVLALFGLGCVALSFVLLDNPVYGMAALPIIFTFLLFSQFRSKIAIDGLWKATHQRGTPMYNAAMTGVSIVTIAAWVWYLFALKSFI
jgi:hypothetical protein